MTKAGLLYHAMRHLIKNQKNTHITVKYSRSPIPQVGENKKQYTARNVKRADMARKLHHIYRQPVEQILLAIYNNILQNVPILGEDVGMSEEIYLPSVPHLQDKIVRHKIQHVEPIIIPSVPKGIFDR